MHSTTEIALGNLTTLSVEYIPNAHYSGSDSFTYVIIDSAGSSNPTKVAVTVEPMPNRPTASSSTIPVDFKEASDVAVMNPPAECCPSPTPSAGKCTTAPQSGFAICAGYSHAVTPPYGLCAT